MALAAVRDLREFRDPVSAEELEQFETDVLAGFVLARASAGLADGTIRGDVGHLDQIRAWFGRPLWDMEPADADGYFGKVLRGSPSGTRLARAQALTTYSPGPSPSTSRRTPQWPSWPRPRSRSPSCWPPDCVRSQQPSRNNRP